MSLALLGDAQEGFIPGGNGKRFVQGLLKFNAADANGELPVRLTRLDSIQLTPVTVPATDETAYCDELSAGAKTVKAGGTVTIKRTGAAPGNNGVYSYFAIGI